MYMYHIHKDDVVIQEGREIKVARMLEELSDGSERLGADPNQRPRRLT